MADFTRYAVRSGGAGAMFWVGLVVAGFVLATPILINDWPVFWALLGPVLLAAWGLWIVLWHSSAQYGADGIRVVNPGRIHEVPWSRIVAIRQEPGLSLELETGRRLSVWGAPQPLRRGLLVGSLAPSRSSLQLPELLGQFRANAARSDAPVASRWDVLPLAIGGTLALVVTFQLVLTLV